MCEVKYLSNKKKNVAGSARLVDLGDTRRMYYKADYVLIREDF